MYKVRNETKKAVLGKFLGPLIISFKLYRILKIQKSENPSGVSLFLLTIKKNAIVQRLYI